MFWRLVLAGLFVVGAAAFAPAPIRWAGQPLRSFFIEPKLHHSVSLLDKPMDLPLQLAIWDLDSSMSPAMIPRFSAQPDKSIMWDAMGLCVEACGNAVCVNRCTGKPNQLWDMSHDSRDQSHIRMQGSNKCIDVHETEGGFNGASIVLRECDNAVTNLWRLEEPTSLPANSFSHHARSSLQQVLFYSISMAAIGALSLSAWLWRWQTKVASFPAGQGAVSLQTDDGGVTLHLRDARGLHVNAPLETASLEFPSGTAPMPKSMEDSKQCSGYNRYGSPTMCMQPETEIAEVGNTLNSNATTPNEIDRRTATVMYAKTQVKPPVAEIDTTSVPVTQLSGTIGTSVMYKNGATKQSNTDAVSKALPKEMAEHVEQLEAQLAAPDLPKTQEKGNGVKSQIAGWSQEDQIGNAQKSWHSSHNLHAAGNVVFCSSCGGYTDTMHSDILSEPCKSVPSNASNMLQQGRHPTTGTYLGEVVRFDVKTISERSLAAKPTSLKEGVPPESRRGHFPAKPTPLLDSLDNEGPQKVREMSIPQLVQLSDEVRWQVLDAVSVTGGHLGSALGVVELTVALHHVFDTPKDELIWDVAHQVYPHKILTGRRDRIYTLRQGGGLSGFAKRSESEYDAFGAGHSTTSISAAVGFQAARESSGEPGHAVAIIGDGAITGGMAWEAMNHAGGLGSKIIVILNDNGQVSLPTFYNQVDKPVGALSNTLAESDLDLKQSVLSEVATSSTTLGLREFVKQASKTLLPEQLSSAAAKAEENLQNTLYDAVINSKSGTSASKGEIFEQLGFSYFGPIDGHDMTTLTKVLANLKKQHTDGRIEKPILLHVKSTKGKGYEPAENASDKLHAVGPKFNLPKPSQQSAPKKSAPSSFTSVFGNSLVREGKRDDNVVAITAAMPGGTGVSIFEEHFPSRTYDVGIAEQHAVTFAAGLAAGGLKPFCCIYSTFLQRGYDQLVHDVAIQNLPVRFVLDRAGLVGADGPTHYGSFDLSFMACIPNMKICSPSDEVELSNMVHTLTFLDDGPVALRYPRGSTYGDLTMPAEPERLTPGKGRIVRQGSDGTVAILSVGTRLRESLRAAEALEAVGVSATVADARWVKPIDEELIKKLCAEHRVLITVEENSIGGFSSQVNQILQENGILDGVRDTPFVSRNMFLPDRYLGHDAQDKQYDAAELNADDIQKQALSALLRAGLSHVVDV